MARSTTLPLALVALFTIVSGATGCSGCDKPGDGAADAAPSTSATPASTSATVVATEAGAPDAGGATAEEPGRRGMRRGGPSAQLFQAARELTLTPEQTTKVDAAEKLGAPAGDTSAKDAAKELHAELTGGIKAGKIDTAKLEPKYVVLEKLAIAEHDKEVESLNALHVALDATQRKAVSAAVRAKAAKRDERMAHTDAGGPDGGKAAGGRAIDRMVRGLELDADQQKKIDAITTKETPKFDPAEMKKRMETLLAAFEKDGFDAKKADGFDAKKSRVALEEQTKLLGQVLPILKPEQREKLASKMEKGPSPHGARRPGHRPPSQDEAENDDDFLP